MRVDHPRVRTPHRLLPGTGHGPAYIVSPRLTRTHISQVGTGLEAKGLASLSTFTALSLAFLIWLCAVSINLTGGLP